MQQTHSAEDFRTFKGFLPHFRPPEGTLNWRSEQDLGQAPRAYRATHHQAVPSCTP